MEWDLEDVSIQFRDTEEGNVNILKATRLRARLFLCSESQGYLSKFISKSGIGT